MAYTFGVIGVGGIGGYYGAKLQHAGEEVHFLLRNDFRHVCRYGLRVQSVTGDFVLPQVNAYQQSQHMPPCDVVLVALKATHNDLIPDLVAPLLKPDTTVVLLQNGLGAEPQLSQALPGITVVGGLCFICTTRIAPGHIHHLDYGSIVLAEYLPGYQPCAVSPRVAAIAEIFQAAGIPTQVMTDLLLCRWQKLVWNIPFNALAVLLSAQTDAMMRDPELVALIQEVMQEVQQTAAAYGREIPNTFVEGRLEHTRRMQPYTPSTQVDFAAGRELEVEAIWGNPWRAAQQKGIPTPHMAMLYRQLRFLNAHNLRASTNAVTSPSRV
ncbi:MAG: putative 2-dehydropantoate 2-reductase [Synechococcales cyanobacterium]